ncbi:MAG: FG-GAP-like repeat-containing protein [Vicinamibacterales bacterium]
MASSSLLRRVRRFAGIALVAIAVYGGSGSLATAADFTVTKIADTNDGSCNADCSLREAIVAANLTVAADRIILGSGLVYTLSLGSFDPAGTILPATGDLDITQPLTIDGNGSIVDAAGIDRVFDIQGAFTVTINSLTIKNGVAKGFLSLGGGISVRGASLTLNNAIVTANSTMLESGERDDGGGIAVVGSFNEATGIATPAGLTLSNTIVSGNTGAIGGGILCVLCTLTPTAATISGNVASGGDGGGIAMTGNSSTLSLLGGTISFNTVSGGGARGGALSVPAGASMSTLRLARIVSNSGTTGSAIYNNVATVNAPNDWWGCNFGPGAGGAGCAAPANSVSGLAATTNFSPFLLLKATASNASLPAGGSSTLAVDLTINSLDADTSATGTIPNGTPVNFSATLGTMTPPSSTTVSGKTAAVYTAGAAGGIASLGATVDAQTVTAAVAIGGPPAITEQPQSRTIVSGQTATLTVVATGTAPMSYQWYSGTSPGTASPIGGATSSSYTTPPLSHIASYWVRVTTPYGGVDSSSAIISVSSALGVFRPSAGRWIISGQADLDWGVAGDLPVPGDYDGDGVREVAVFRRANGTWYINGGATIVWGAPGDIPVPADYDGNGTTDVAVFRPSAGMFYIRNGASVAWGAAGDLPVVADYNGDGLADVAVYRPATGTWYIRNVATVVYGFAADIPAPADYNGDGAADVAVFRPSSGTWFIKDQYTQVWGVSGDVPVPLDRNGDGVAELVVFRRATGTWYFKNHVTDGSEIVSLGAAGDIPLGRALPAVQTPWGDYDGDRKADLTVFRPSTGDWVALRSLSGMTDYTLRTFGLSSDAPVGRDYDGDGRFDPAVYRASTGRWYVLQSSTNYAAYVMQDWGLSSDTPVPADYDGDGRADFAVFRPSIARWVILLSSTANTSYVQYDWGVSGDIPVPADYDGDGRADVAVFRPSTGRWYVLNRTTGAFVVHDWGLTGDMPVAADFDGDGKADVAVFRPSLGRWFIKSSIDGAYTIADWGLSGDTAVPSDFDGDGKADIAVYRPSTGMWYVRGLFNRSWGIAGDIAALKNP